jgi:uncharacterized protein YkwD
MKITFLFSIVLAALTSFASATGNKTQNGPGPKSGTYLNDINKTLILQLINDARKQGHQCGDTYYKSASAVTWNDQLEQAALVHSQDMNTKNYFSHIAPDGSTAGDRIIQAGYNWLNYGENIGMGYKNENEVIEGWLNSPAHCKNIMNPGYKEIGLAKAGKYWTLELARK